MMYNSISHEILCALIGNFQIKKIYTKRMFPVAGLIEMYIASLGEDITGII